MTGLVGSLNRRSLVVGLLAALGVGEASADAFPTKPVRILVPYGPGTGVDLAARIVAEHLGRALGQAFVVENKTGAAGTIAASALASAPADGYTLLMNASSHTSVPALMKHLPYDAARDFTGVAMIGESALVLVTSKRGGFQSVKALVEAAKAKPGMITFASAGVGTTTHLAAEKFRLAAGFDALHVPYKSTTDALAEVMGGRVDFLITTLPSALGPIRDGRLVALAVSPSPSPLLPGVNNFAAAGFARAETGTWFAMFAPVKTPTRVVVSLHDAIDKALASPDVKERLAVIGADTVSMSLESLNAMLRKEFVENAELIKTAGIKLD